MKKGILGRKLGMTQVFTKNGRLIPVTVVSVEPNIITQIKTEKKDGYNAIQLAYDTKREKLTNKPEIGHLSKAKTTPKRFLREIRDVDIKEYEVGQQVTVEIFQAGEMVDVSGTSKGKGFQGSIKRHNYSRGPMGHGSHYHRGSGSLGTMLPKRVFRGTKLPGHMGVDTITIQNLEIVMVDTENNALLVKGNIPGSKKSLVIIKTAVKNEDVINEFEGLNFYDEEITKQEKEVVEEEVTEETTEQETTEETIEQEATVEEATEETIEQETTVEEAAEETIEQEATVEEVTEETTEQETTVEEVTKQEEATEVTEKSTDEEDQEVKDE